MKIVSLFLAASSLALASSVVAQNIDTKDEKARKIETQAAVAKTFYYPKRPNQYGQLDYIFIEAKNGTQFCKEEGYRNATGGSIYCGEDESTYVEFDWYSQTWKSKSTGSKNQCYPLYRSITCK